MNKKAAALAKHLQLNYKRKYSVGIDSIYLEAENEWAVSQFLFLLLKASKVDHFLLPSQLWDFHSKYENENRVKIDLDALLEKQWIRFIAKDIEIPLRISSMLGQLSNDKELSVFIEENKSELLFLKALEQEINSAENALIVPKKVVEKLIVSYRNIYPALPNLNTLLAIGILKASKNNTHF
jgi:hypothetical protein